MTDSRPGGLTRRAFTAGLGLAPAARLTASAAAPSHVKTIDAHAHLAHHSRPDWARTDRWLIDAADKLEIDQLCCSLLPPGHNVPADVFRQCNTWAEEAIRRYPGRILGYCFVNPGWVRESQDEIRRSVEKLGFIGVKLYNDYVATEAVLHPLFELCIDLKIPILHHAGHPTWLSPPQPRISDGGTFAQVAKRYPEAMIICAHIAGGGDWEWTIKALRQAPSVFLDTSGSNMDEGIVEMCVNVLGADRVLFACDQSMTASVGRIRSVELSETDRAKILGGNMQRILSRRRTA
jgi:predicted TIM-barrel fold metal-dependent hydrolase